MARSTFSSQNVQNTPRSDHFWKLRCRKSAHRCGAKHIFKSYKTHHVRTTFEGCDVEKVHAVVARSIFRSQHVQNTTFGPLLEVPMWKKRTPLWREAHFEVNMLKAPGVRTTFGMSKKCTPVWRKIHFEVKMLKRTRVFGPLLEVQMSLRFASVHYTTLHNTTLQLQVHNYTTTLHYTPLH